MSIDITHSADLRSWVESANSPETDFPIQNLPFGVFTGPRMDNSIGVAIGDSVFSLRAAADAGLLDGAGEDGGFGDDIVAAVRMQNLNQLFALGRGALSALRARVSILLRSDTAEGQRARDVADLVIPVEKVEMVLPVETGDYTDFYASIDHATNVGSMFRPDNPLLPNYRHVPIGYHGRASSIVASGTRVKRPGGQTVASPEGPPVFGPSARIDYELEVGAVIGKGNGLGSSVSIDDAESHLAGLVLVNDWSARDMQAWEYQPLGPFLAKNFATTVSPWVVTLDALEPFRIPSRERGGDEPSPLPYLAADSDRKRGGFDLTLEVWIRTAKMREAGLAAERLSRGSFSGMYWTLAQMLTHHTSNGCNMRSGDLIASGTVSGPAKDSRGCLLELAWRGTEPVALNNGETRAFLADGDEVILKGWCERPGFARVGFGECSGILVP